MDKFKFVLDFPENLKELELIDEQDKTNDKTEEMISNSYISSLKKRVVLGAITFFLATSSSSISVDTQETPYEEQRLCDIDKDTDFFNEIEQEVKIVSALQKSQLEKRIDGDEIQEEMEIISNYMSNVKKYYETRKKRFKI